MMHLKTLLLLAVQSNVIIAGLIRHGHFARSDVHVRSFKQSAINDAAVQPLESAEPPKPLITDPPSLSSPQTPLTITTKQIGSVPAVGSGPRAAKIDEEDIVSANTEPPDPLPTTSTVSFAKEDQGSIASTSKQIGKVPAVGSGPDAATLPAAEVASANTQPPVLSSTASPASSIIPSPSATSSSSSFGREGDDPPATLSKQVGIVPAVGSGSDPATLPAGEVASAETKRFSTTEIVTLTTSLLLLPRQNQTSSAILASTFSSGQPVVPIITSVPVAGTSNVAMAQTFNQFFDAMNADSRCDPTKETQRMVCIDKKTAVCGANGKYTLSACSQNEICRAVPLDGTQTGIAIKCVPAVDTSQPSSSKSAEADGAGTAPSRKTTVQAEPTKTKPFLSAVSPAPTTKSVLSAVSPLSSPGRKLPTVIITTQTIVVTPLPKTTVQAEPSETKPLLSAVSKAPTSQPFLSVVSALASSLEGKPPKVVITTQTEVVKPLPKTSTLLQVSPAPKETPRPTPKPETSEQPAIVIVPLSRKGP